MSGVRPDLGRVVQPADAVRCHIVTVSESGTVGSVLAMKTRLIVFAIVLAGCGTDGADPTVLADGFAVPLDLSLDGTTLYSLHYDGAIRATPLDGSAGWDVVAPTKQLQDNEILVEPSGYNLLVDGSHVYWMAHEGGHAEVRRAVLHPNGLATDMEVLDTSLQPFPDLARVGDRVCWTSATQIACVDPDHSIVTPLVALRARPQGLVDAGGIVYWGERGLLDAGTGGVYSIDMGTTLISDVVTSLHEPRGVALAGDRLYWLDNGTCTREGSACYGNHDASVHFVSLASGAIVLDHAGLGSFDSDDLAVAGETVFYAADGGVWRTDQLGGTHNDELAHETCLALATDESTVYCASMNDGIADGMILALRY